MRRLLGLSGCFWIMLLVISVELAGTTSCAAAVTREEVERAIREGVRFLKSTSAGTAPGPTSKTTPRPAPRAWSRWRC